MKTLRMKSFVARSCRFGTRRLLRGWFDGDDCGREKLQARGRSHSPGAAGSPTTTCTRFPLTEVAKSARSVARAHILEWRLRPELALGHGVERFPPSLPPSDVQRSSRTLQPIFERIAGKGTGVEWRALFGTIRRRSSLNGLSYAGRRRQKHRKAARNGAQADGV